MPPGAGACPGTGRVWLAAELANPYLCGMIETELKFLPTPEQTAAILAALDSLPGLEEAPETRTLRSVYYDTQDQALRRARIALRLRHEGGTWVQTVKTKSSHHGALQSGQEFTTDSPDGQIAPDRILDPEIRDRVKRLTDGTALEALLETRMQRMAAVVTLPCGSRAEIALDRGEIKSGDRSEPFSELEIELLSGKVAGLFDLARQLLPDGGLTLSRASKAARGYALATGKPVLAIPAPRKAQSVALKPDARAEDAARAVLRECFDQITENVDCVLANDAPEGVHQLRIGLRRLRAAFVVFAPVLQSSRLPNLMDEARRVGREVGHLRDLDMALNDLVTPELAARPQDPAFIRLADLIAKQAATQRAALRVELRSGRTHQFLLDLAQFIETRGWLDPDDKTQARRLAQPVAKVAQKALSAQWTKCVKRARGIDGLEDAERHALRKALKGLRYEVEFIAPLLPAKPAAKFIKRLRNLQDLFGSLNDLAMAHTLFDGPDALGATDPLAQRAVGHVLGARTVHADMEWADARALWHALRDAPRPWKSLHGSGHRGSKAT